MAQTILIVDDDPVQRRLLEATIRRSDLEVLTAPGGRPALDLIQGPHGERIHLVLLDLVMPDLDGLSVLAQLRVSHPVLPVIVLTARGGIDSAVEAMRAGANDFLVKPASPERIAVSIRNALNRVASALEPLVPTGRYPIVALPGSARAFAESIGLTPASLSRALAALMRQGVLHRLGTGRYQVVQPEALRRLASGAESDRT